MKINYIKEIIEEMEIDSKTEKDLGISKDKIIEHMKAFAQDDYNKSKSEKQIIQEGASYIAAIVIREELELSEIYSLDEGEEEYE